MLDAALFAACLTLGMDTGLAMSIAETESSGKHYAFNVNRWEGEPVPMVDVDTSVLLSNTFIDQGYTVDVGLMGINSRNVDRLGHTIESAFEPCTNIALGEQIYIRYLQRAEDSGLVGHEAVRAALSQYNTGSMTRGLHNGYVDKVWTRYQEKSSYQARVADINVPWERPERWSDQVTQRTSQWSKPNE